MSRQDLAVILFDTTCSDIYRSMLTFSVEPEFKQTNKILLHAAREVWFERDVLKQHIWLHSM